MPVTCGHTITLTQYCGNGTDSASTDCHADSVKTKNGKRHANITVTWEKIYTKFCQERDKDKGERIIL